MIAETFRAIASVVNAEVEVSKTNSAVWDVLQFTSYTLNSRDGSKRNRKIPINFKIAMDTAAGKGVTIRNPGQLLESQAILAGHSFGKKGRKTIRTKRRRGFCQATAENFRMARLFRYNTSGLFFGKDIKFVTHGFDGVRVGRDWMPNAVWNHELKVGWWCPPQVPISLSLGFVDS